MTTAATFPPAFDAPRHRPHAARAARRRPSASAALVLSLALALSGVGLSSTAGEAQASTAVSASGTSFTFTGSGWGHGVGMSQYGARGMAASGSNHAQILGHYYTGTQLGSAANGADLRVLIAQRAPRLTLTAGGHTTFNGVGNVGAGATVELTRQGSSIVLSGALNATVTGPLTVRYAGSTNPLRVSPPNVGYRHGELTVRTDTTGLRAVIGQLPMQQYLLGLHEMPASWPLEALKAQVVAGRTYALKKRAERAPAGADFDLYATVTDQAYTGATNEGSWFHNWEKAVADTAGQVLTHNGSLIDAVYSSSSGGHTEHSENVWSAALPYLRGKPDPHDATAGNSNASWSRTYSGAQLGAWFGLGTVTSVTIQGPFGVSGRVDKANIRLVGTGGTKDVRGDSFRITVNRSAPVNQLMSTKFTLAVTTSNTGLPRGDFHTAEAQGNRVVIRGRATDPDGVPQIRVVSTMGSQVAVRHTYATNGAFEVSWTGSPGTRRVCVSAIDVPTGADVFLGCRDVVVK